MVLAFADGPYGLDGVPLILLIPWSEIGRLEPWAGCAGAFANGPKGLMPES